MTTLQQAKQRMADILDSHGIELSIFYYGERTEVAVGFRYRGESVFEDEHDFTFSNFKEEEEDSGWPAGFTVVGYGVTGSYTLGVKDGWPPHDYHTTIVCHEQEPPITE